MTICPYQNALIDSETGLPLEPELASHLLVCPDCAADWKVIRLIRSTLPEDPEAQARWDARMEALIPRILASLPGPYG